MQLHGKRVALRHALHGEEDEGDKAGTSHVQAPLMAVRVEREPSHLRPVVANGPQHGKSAEIVEAVCAVKKDVCVCLFKLYFLG